MTERLYFHFSLSCIGEGNGNPLQCSCLENPRDGEPGGLPSMGSHRVRHDWSDLAAAAAAAAVSAGCQQMIRPKVSKGECREDPEFILWIDNDTLTQAIQPVVISDMPRVLGRVEIPQSIETDNDPHSHSIYFIELWNIAICMYTVTQYYRLYGLALVH